jgi:predicted amidohydrolase YtcJ
VKLFADGGVAPALDVHLDGKRLAFGILFAGLEQHVEDVVARGFRVAVHAIGNAGLDAALDAFAAAARRRDIDHRFRVEHACLASTTQLRRLADLGGVAVVQPGFLHHLGQQVEGVVFDDATWLPFADIQRSGAVLAASSDCPCTFHEPLRTSSHGASRRTGSGRVLDADQAVTYEDWLRAYTAGAAYAGGQENERGSLAEGLRADLVVLEGELDADDPPVVTQTWIGGRLVHESSKDGPLS